MFTEHPTNKIEVNISHFEESHRLQHKRVNKLNKFSLPNAPIEAIATDRKKVSKRANSNKRVINKKKLVDCSVNNGFTIISSFGTSLTGFNLSNGFSETCFIDSLVPFL